MDVSANGSIVVGSSASERGGEAFRWTAATGMVGLGLSPDGFRTVANGVSDDGSVIVGDGRTVPEPTFGDQAFRWTAATGIVGLGDLPGGGLYSEARDVSEDGSVVVGRSTTDKPDFSAFRWTEATGMVELPPVRDGIPFVGAEGVSGNGKVIVGSGAIVWDEFHGSRVLRELLLEQGVDLGDWNPVVARSTSYDGETIAGLARSPTLGSQAFVARLNPGTFIPEPSSLVLSGIGLLIALTVALRTLGLGTALR
jgi:probable HAF family extracellular repeat protein